MEHNHSSSNPPLRKEPSDISNFSAGSTPTLIPSPQSPYHNRAAYQPITPLPEEEDISYKGAGTFAQRSQAFGLGINVDTNRRTPLARVPVGSKASPGIPLAYDPLLSPPTDVGGMGYYDDDEHVLRGNHSFTPNSEHEALRKKSLSSIVKRMDPPGVSHFLGGFSVFDYQKQSLPFVPSYVLGGLKSAFHIALHRDCL